MEADRFVEIIYIFLIKLLYEKNICIKVSFHMVLIHRGWIYIAEDKH